MSKDEVKPLDISSFDTTAACDAGAEIELLAPGTNAKTGMFITVLGKDSEVFREHTKNNINENLRKRHQAEKKGKEAPVATAEEIEQKAIELLVLSTIGWRQETPKADKSIDNQPCLFYKGEWLSFNVANAKRLYSEQLWIRRQVDEAIGDLENFMKA